MESKERQWEFDVCSRPMNEENGEGRDGSAGSGKRLQAHEVSMEEYNDLAKRLDTMEASVGFVLNKVEWRIDGDDLFLHLELFRLITSLRNLMCMIKPKAIRRKIENWIWKTYVTMKFAFREILLFVRQQRSVQPSTIPSTIQHSQTTILITIQ